jgi:hypothetical protein
MTTRQLWRALRRPLKDHPLYQRVTDDTYDDRTRWNRLLQNLLTQGQLWILPLLFMTNMRTIPLVVLGGTLGGIIWAISISSRIHAEQNKHTYELLCVTPGGTIGVVWATITGCLHRERTFDTINSGEAWVIRILVFVPFILSANLFMERFFGVTDQITIFWIVALMAIFYLDHVQSMVLGCLCAAVSTHLPVNIDKRLGALIGFLAFQVSTYLITVVVSMVILPALYPIADIQDWLVDFTHPFLTLVVFYLSREFIIGKLWQCLCDCLGIATPSDETLLQLGRSQNVADQPYDDAEVVARA